MRRVNIIIIVGLFIQASALFGQGAADCKDFIVICSSTTLALNSSGTGNPDFNNTTNPVPVCWSGFAAENQSLWLKVPVAEDGILEFTIAPNNLNDDFDFAIFGPNVDCNNLGNAVRCSTTNPQLAGVSAMTGLSASEMDENEGPGQLGNGFVSVLPVKAGEEYIIFIDNFSASNGGFELQWGNSNPLFTPPIVENPGDVLYCDGDGDGSVVIELGLLDDQISRSGINTDVKYYLSERDAQLDENQLDPRAYTLDVNQRRIFARVTTNDNGCFGITSFNAILTVVEPLGAVTGPRSVCPTVEGVPYTLVPSNADRYDWFVDGGTLASGQGTTDVTIDWGQTNNDAMVKVVGKIGAECVSDTLFFPVRVNRRLEPETPRGPEMVCLDDLLNPLYSVPPIPGSEYEWGVENGTIVGPNDENAVEVAWNDGETQGRVFLREFNPSIAECEGFSDTLRIEILPRILVAPTVTQSLCAGDNSGRIDLNPSGGSGAFIITWDDTNETGPTRQNLSPGTYTYTVTDEMGCFINNTVMVTEPEVISLADLNPIDASCFESADGGLTAVISGGTGDYRYTINGQTVPIVGNSLEIQNLARGTYDLEVRDENDCVFTIPITVDSPALLEPDVANLMIQDACPGQSDGSININAVGGTPDYQFFWTPINETGRTVNQLPSGEYTVRIVDMNNCEASLEVFVSEVQPRVQVPDAFSPNGDGENDAFAPVSNCPLSDYQFRVFNRWGTMVFATDNQFAGWSGRVNGEDAPEGRYSYKLVYRIVVNGQLIEESVSGIMRLFR